MHTTHIAIADNVWVPQSVHVAMLGGCDDHVLAVSNPAIGCLVAYVIEQLDVRRDRQIEPGMHPECRHREIFMVVVQATLVPVRMVGPTIDHFVKHAMRPAGGDNRIGQWQVLERFVPVRLWVVRCEVVVFRNPDQFFP